jgi:hypothetical protein
MDTEQHPPRSKEARLPEMDLSSDISAMDELAEKRLIRKMDIYILPFVVLLYLFSFLDRGTLHPLREKAVANCVTIVNIGNARLYGLEKDLGLVGDQYQVAVSILFVTYCVCSVRGLYGLACLTIVCSSLRFLRI